MATPQMGVWGIDLGQCALKAIRLEQIGGELSATAFDYIEHPKILSQPDADPDELTREALQQFLSRNSIKGDMVVISVAGHSGLARFVKLPPVEEKKIADIVKFEAKQQIPFPLEEVVWDFQKIGQGLVTDGFAMETEIGLFAMKKDMVHRSIQQFKDVKVEIHVIQMAPLALCNYVSYDLLHKDGLGGVAGEGEPADSKECVVALDIGTDNSNLIITDGEKIIWQRPIPLGGNHFTRALTKDMKLTFAKAEHLKRNAVKSPELKKILASLKTVLNDFVGEVQRSLGYFTNTHRDATIKYMIGLGNAFRLPGLQKYLQEKLQLEVRKLSKLERVSGEEVVAAPTFKENLLSFAVAYGLALQGLKLSRIQTNLLPYEIRVERIVRGKKPWAVAAAASLLLAVAALNFGYSVENRGVSNPEIATEMKRANDAVKKREDFKIAHKLALDRKQKAEEAIRKIGAGVEERFNWQRLLQYVNLALPTPNGDKLVDNAADGYFVKKKYFNENAKKAFDLLEKKRFFTKGEPLQPQEEEFIKKHLIQVNVEGINALYSDDLGAYFKNVYNNFNKLLQGMTDAEKADVVKWAAADEAGAGQARAKLPKSGWIVEIRGYTYHDGQDDFVKYTFVENLARQDSLLDKSKVKLSKELQETINLVKKQVSYLTIQMATVNPKDYDGGKYKIIEKSHLQALLKDPAPPPPPTDGASLKLPRDKWKPLGTIASTNFPDSVLINQPQQVAAVPLAKDAPPVMPLQQRTEFIILFYWNEPLPGNLPAPDAKKQ